MLLLPLIPVLQYLIFANDLLSGRRFFVNTRASMSDLPPTAIDWRCKQLSFDLLAGNSSVIDTFGTRMCSNAIFKLLMMGLFVRQ